LHSSIPDIPQNILRSEGKQMSSEQLLSNIVPFAGSGLLGYAMGFALKKVLKWMLIIVGFLAGMFFVGVQLLQKYGYVSTVNWDKLSTLIIFLCRMTFSKSTEYIPRHHYYCVEVQII
jgi:uncharacterized membrane protein (Fun14 family)